MQWRNLAAPQRSGAAGGQWRTDTDYGISRKPQIAAKIAQPPARSRDVEKLPMPRVDRYGEMFSTPVVDFACAPARFALYGPAFAPDHTPEGSISFIYFIYAE